MKKTKKKVELCGNLLFPITIGKGAVFSAEGLVYHTSRVIALHEQTIDYIRFETLNTDYHLSLSPFPMAVISPLPERLAACA